MGNAALEMGGAALEMGIATLKISVAALKVSTRRSASCAMAGRWSCMAPCAIKTLISRCYAAQGLRHAFLPAIVSTSGRIHGELLRLLFNLTDKKTSNSLEALGEAIDVESEVYCRRRSGNFWRMRASLGLACAQAAGLGTQVVGRPRSRPRAAARPRP